MLTFLSCGKRCHRNGMDRSWEEKLHLGSTTGQQQGWWPTCEATSMRTCSSADALSNCPKFLSFCWIMIVSIRENHRTNYWVLKYGTVITANSISTRQMVPPPSNLLDKWMTEQGLPKKVRLIGMHGSVGFSQLHECNMPKVLQNKTPQFHV